MKKLFIAGNWKSNKTISETNDWKQKFHMDTTDTTDTTVVLCVPYTLLLSFQSESHPFQLGAQNVSPFSEGAYTGEISARQIKELADWVIVGHSERRKYFGENDEILAQKVRAAKDAGLKIIYCVPDEHAPIPTNVDVVAYEPVWAIGTGKTDSPENANAVIHTIKESKGVNMCIYGGSVTEENIKSFVTTEYIDGVLPGGASLDPVKFSALVRNAVA